MAGRSDGPRRPALPAKLRLGASTDTGDADVAVMVADVAADGTSTQVSRGLLNAPRFFDCTKPLESKPGRPYRFDIEVWPQSQVLDKGHRIRVSVAGGATQTAQAPALHPDRANIRILQGGRRASFPEIPIVGTARLSAAPRTDRP